MTTTNSKASLSTSYRILFAHNPDGRDGCVAVEPVLVIAGEMSAEKWTDLMSSILVRYLAQGAADQYPRYEEIVAEEINQIKPWAAEGGTICVNNEFFTLQPLAMPDDEGTAAGKIPSTLNVQI